MNKFASLISVTPMARLIRARAPSPTSAPTSAPTSQAATAMPGPTPPRPQRHLAALPQARGFTLIELLIVLLISLVLCVLAWPRFEAQVFKARRSEAQTALASLLHAQARYRSNHRRYAYSLAELGMAAPPLRHYEIRLRGLSTSDAGGAADDPFQQGFIAVATPLPGSPQMRDAPCAELRVMLDGQQLSQTAIDRAGSTSDTCWPK